MLTKIKTIWNRLRGRGISDLPDLPIELEGSLGHRRVSLALDMMKYQCHDLELNARANQGFIENFRLKLRDTARARKLCAMRPDLPLWKRAYYYNSWMINLAACILLVMLGKVNFSSLSGKSVTYSQDKVYSIYAKQCDGDSELLDVFSEMRKDHGRSDV